MPHSAVATHSTQYDKELDRMLEKNAGIVEKWNTKLQLSTFI